uniref:Uncharacterized protein n=1 Tax=Anguilla anguilla TaxID=7936 RepID=A0A0E9QKR6_ANGAN
MLTCGCMQPLMDIMDSFSPLIVLPLVWS